MATRTTPLIPIGTWEVDPAHSSVDFAVKHMGIANVRGKFTEFAGSLDMKEALANCSARGSITVSSIDTGDEGRDVHLRAGDFFDVEHHPLITFESTRVEAIDDESSRVYGNLTMHGVTMESSSTSSSTAPTPTPGETCAWAWRSSACSCAAISTCSSTRHWAAATRSSATRSRWR
ncbi:MAG: YceI family protein, partial [Solirubrobacteraceae bacterium]